MNDKHSPQTLGWWMDERRGELGLTWDQVAELAGVSVETLRRAAQGSGEVMRTTTKKGIERALQWASDYLDRIARGLPPTPNEPEGGTESSERDERAEILHQMDAKLAELQELQRRLAALGQKRETG